MRRSNAAHAWWGSSPTTLPSPAWWGRCCCSKTSTGSWRAGGCSRPRAWPKSLHWNSCPASPRCRKQRLEPTSCQAPGERRCSAPTGRSGAAHRPGAGANRSSKHSAVVNNQEAIEAKDLTSQSSGFMVKRRGTHLPRE